MGEVRQFTGYGVAIGIAVGLVAKDFMFPDWHVGTYRWGLVITFLRILVPFASFIHVERPPTGKEGGF